jgi:hypothetical protein
MFGRLLYLGGAAVLASLALNPAWAQDDTTSAPAQQAAAPVTSPDQIPPGMAPTPSLNNTIPREYAPTSTASSANTLPDAANATKFYTITASLREEYDDNIYTTRDNKVGSAVTEFSPSVLVNFPMQDSTFSGRYTFGIDYYAQKHRDVNDYTNEALLRYTHNFSDRYTLDLRDQAGYYTQPDLLNAEGTPYRNGEYFVNTATAEFDAQWTPLFGTATSYSNVAFLYSEGDIAKEQNFDENTFSNDFRFAVYPKYNLVAGVIFDDIDYFETSRGYTDYTGNVGLDWAALPSLTFSGRVGGTVTESDASDSVSPYAMVSVDWRLGKRSDLSLSYLHNVVPTDVANAVGQEADRFSARFNYDFTARLSGHLAGTYTHSDYTPALLLAGPSFTEDDIGLDTGLEYHVTSNFSFEGGYSLSDISSQVQIRDYTRNQLYLGVRGTY